MAAVAPEPARETPGPWPSPEEIRTLVPLLRLLVKVWSVESVQRIALSTDGYPVDVWVLMREEVPADEERILLAERDCLAEVGPIPFELHVFPLSKIEESLLPPAETILER